MCYKFPPSACSKSSYLCHDDVWWTEILSYNIVQYINHYLYGYCWYFVYEILWQQGHKVFLLCISLYRFICFLCISSTGNNFRIWGKTRVQFHSHPYTISALREIIFEYLFSFPGLCSVTLSYSKLRICKDLFFPYLLVAN